MLYAKAYLDVIRRYCRSGSVLDIGSSTNPLPNLLAQAGYSVTVADYVRPPDLAPGVRYIEATLDEQDGLEECPADVYDVVSCFAVIEHCRSPRSAAEAMARVCVPGGTLVLTTPEIGCFADRSYLGRSRWFCPPEHLHLVSRRGIEALFGEFDCSLLKVGKFELNGVRWLARYGMLLVEGVLGAVAKRISRQYWEHARASREARGQGIALYVFKKTGAGS